MKTGFDLLVNEKFDPLQLEFLRKTVALMKILTDESMQTSQRFVKACGRKFITGNDMYYALMYEAHEFFNKNIDDKFFANLAEEQQHTYETDDDDDDDDDDYNEEGVCEEETDEIYSIECKFEDEKEFHSKVLKYANEWRSWLPDDPVKMMVKNAIDKTRNDHKE